SRSAVLGGAAVRLAALQVREKMLQLAAHLMEAAPEDLDISGGVVSVIGTPSRAVSISRLAAVAYTEIGALPQHLGPGLEATARYAGPTYTFSNAAHMCTCEVNV